MRSLRSYFITTLLRVVFKRQKPGALPVQQQRDDFIKMMARTYKPQPGVKCDAGELGELPASGVATPTTPASAPFSTCTAAVIFVVAQKPIVTWLAGSP